MDDTRRDLTRLLVDAHTNELALINVLSSHIPLTENDSYRRLLEEHLEETRDHADRVGRRLEDLGHSKSLLAAAYETAQGAIKQLLVLGKAPVDMIRGGGNVKEKMLRNAMDEVMTEGLEIASYDAIESLARTLGDTVTAELAASIRLDEEQMFDSLRKLIPVLAADVGASAAPRIGATQPWDGYDDMTVEEINNRLDGASISMRLAVREYELQNKNRSTVVKFADPENATL